MIISPTGQGVRSDKHGNGSFNAKRGTRKHNGVDFVCRPGQFVNCPIARGHVVRVARPYADDDRFSGLYIENAFLSLKLFYFRPFPSVVGKTCRRGEPIGIAQDISAKYDPGMIPHIHLQIDRVDPNLLLQIEAYLDSLIQLIKWD